MKKNFVTIVVFCLAISWATGQQVIEKSARLQGNQTLVFDVDFADQIIIKTWDKKEVLTKVTYNINDNKDNSKFHLDLMETSDNVTFTGTIDDMKSLSENNSTDLPGVVIRQEDHCVKLEIDYEIFMPANASVSLETISGNIEMIGCQGPAKIKTISGFIDVSVSQATKADFSLSTISGELYSDLNLKMDKPHAEMRVFVGGNVDATFNGGGALFDLETISGDIFLRKLK